MASKIFEAVRTWLSLSHVPGQKDSLGKFDDKKAAEGHAKLHNSCAGTPPLYEVTVKEK
jgi:hypothetical protein